MAVEIYKDPTPITSDRSPARDLAKQVGGARAPAKGGRSLAVVMRAVAVDPSTLDAATMEYDYVVRGQADVERCFEVLREKVPAARGEITLRFTVDTSGVVLVPKVTGFDADVAKCVQASMPGWKFTAPDKPTRFELVLDLVIG